MTKFMLLLLFLPFPLLEHASLLIVQTIVFVEYRKRILMSFYSVFIGFVSLFILDFERDFAAAFVVCM